MLLLLFNQAAAGVSVNLGGVADIDRAGGLALTPGVATVTLGGAREVERAGGLGIQPGAVTVALGGYAEREGLGGIAVNLSGVVISVGGVRELELAGGVTLYQDTFSNKGRGRVGLAALDGTPRVGDANVQHSARVGGRVLRRRS